MSGRNRHRSQASQMSSKSMKSVRTIDRAQYHEDLKLTLKRPVTKNLLFGNFIVMFGCSFLFGYNLGVLNLLKEVIKTNDIKYYIYVKIYHLLPAYIKLFHENLFGKIQLLKS